MSHAEYKRTFGKKLSTDRKSYQQVINRLLTKLSTGYLIDLQAFIMISTSY